MNKEHIILISDSQHIFKINATDDKLKVTKVSTSNLASLNTLITFQSDELVNQLECDVHAVNILDFECLDKQIRQSCNLNPIQEKWNISNMIATYLGEDEREWRQEEYEELLKKLALCYREMKIKGREEWNRITNIEIPVNNILYEIQSKGIYFNHDVVSPMCIKLHKDIYYYKNQIQLNLNYSGDDLISYLNRKKIPHKLNDKSNEKEIKFFCKNNPELRCFWEVKKGERNLKCLLSLSAIKHNSNTCKPIFKGFGSSTGRIYLREPALQNLSKNYRILLQENLKSEWRYEYIDFSQFEAGILAYLTQNKKLQELYTKEIIYESIGSVIHSDRETAKTYFYAFIYGGVIIKESEKFFEEYELNKSVNKIIKDATDKGYIKTVLGNKRIINGEEDNRWILNHFIQGTSSVIFKQALINVNKTFLDDVELVIPIHDAALYKVKKNVKTEKIIEQFKNAFIKWIPGSTPIVKEKDFFCNCYETT